jgi:uncharacterized membrane protein
MEKIMVIVFENETKAYQGIKVLKRLDSEGSVTLHQGVLLRKAQDGKLQLDETAMVELPVQTMAGTAIGALIGLLGGPPGVLFGAATGAVTGMIGDVVVGTLDGDFIKEVDGQLLPGTAAVALDLSEEWVTPIDSEVQPLAKSITRRMKIDVEDDLLARRADASDKELAGLEKELNRATAAQKVLLEKRIEELKIRAKRQMARADNKKRQLKSESQAKVKGLQQKLSAAAKEAKANIEERLTALRQADLEATERLDHAIGEHLRALADRIQGKKTG